jgi:hypothetical protein
MGWKLSQKGSKKGVFKWKLTKTGPVVSLVGKFVQNR